MKIHHKVMHHIHAHVSKHHKKYIFGAGVAFGLGALKILAIAGVFLGVHMSAGKTNASYEALKIYRIEEIFSRINEIAMEEIQESEEENSFSEEAKKKFYELDAEYHTTQDVRLEYIASKKMVDFLREQEKYRPIVTGDQETDLEKDNEYRALLEEFYTIQ